MNDVQMIPIWWGDWAWWVIQSISLQSVDKGFWTCLGDTCPKAAVNDTEVVQLDLRYIIYCQANIQ